MAITNWKIDPVHTHAQFSVRHLMITNVKGAFTKTSGSVSLDEDDFTRSQVEARIEAASIDTREPQRDGHLRSPDFFDVEKYPELTFRSTAITRRDDGFRMTGELTIHGTTRPIELSVEAPGGEAKDPWGGTRRGFEASGELSRKEYGLVWNQALEAGGVAVGDKVKLSLEVQLVKE